MKPLHAIIVFAVLVLSAAASGLHEYRMAEQAMVNDMDRALALTLKDKQEGWITPDTIRDYRSHLRMDVLREHSIIYYAMDYRQRGLRSTRMRWQRNADSIVFQGYANCSVAAVLMVSDQRASALLTLLAMAWMAVAMAHFRKHREGVVVVGGMAYREADRCFYDAHRQPIHLTPMQHQLMAMFFSATDHTLDKQQICDALWPKKPDATDTLYTLVKRLKPIVEERGQLHIVSDRGKDYRLQPKR